MEDLPYIKFKNLYVIPTFHSRISFSKLVRTAFFQIYPDMIAVELPNNVRDEVIEGIERLPYLSIIAYADTLNPKAMNFIPIDPGDSIIEAVNLGLEHNTPIEFIDLSVKDYAPPVLNLPDDHSITKIGLASFYDEIAASFKNQRNEKDGLKDTINLEEYLKSQEDLEKEYNINEKDILREKFMASNLLKMMGLYKRILFVVGMAHWEDIKYYLTHPEKIKDVEIDLLPLDYKKVYNIKSSDARFLLKELPYNTYKWLKFKNKYSKEVLQEVEYPEKLFEILDSFSKVDNIRSIFLKAKDEFQEEFKEFIGLHKLKAIFQYSRNLSLAEDRLLPSLYQLLVCSKNIVDDDYAWKVMEWATKYPHEDESNQYETMKLSMEGGYDPNGRYVRLKRRHPHQYEKDRDIPMKGRKGEKYPGQWRKEWDDNGWNTVSYPPEDIIEEDYFSYIRKKAIKNLKNQRIKIEEFKASIMDGIDIKETIRNWAHKKKIYVRNELQVQGKMDTIVVIFDKDDKEPEKYPYCLTWLAEHYKESDFPFYSTNPGEYLIGPGISHVEIGGLLSIFPPIQIPDIWRSNFDYLFKGVNDKAERLLKAAIIYSKEHYIAYVAEKPPRKYFYSLAGVKHREILFIPLDNFNKESLKTIKHVHILAGKDKRRIAHEYIFLRD